VCITVEVMVKTLSNKISARQIQEELIKDFSAKEDLSDWWSREDEAGPSKPKRPNPRNIRNQEKLQELEEEIKRYFGHKPIFRNTALTLS
jgi:hypothetical protein